MSSYLSQSIEDVIPFIMETLDDLTKEALKRDLAEYTKELCIGDPELAESILEGKKTFPDCIRHVLEKAAKVVAKNVDAMTKEEFESIPKQTVRGKSAQMAGAAIGRDDARKWAYQYYYGGRVSGGDTTKKATEKKAARKPASGKSAKKASAATKDSNAGGKKASADLAPENGTAEDAVVGAEQMTMAGFCGTPADEAA